MKIAEKSCLVHEEFLTLPIEEKNLQKNLRRRVSSQYETNKPF